MSGTLQSKILQANVLKLMNDSRGREVESKSGRSCDTPARVKKLTLKDLATMRANRFSIPSK